MDVVSTLARFATTAADAASSGEEMGAIATLIDRWNKGGWGMYPIAIAFVFFVVIVVDRVFTLSRASINKEAFMRGLKKHIYAGDLDKAISYCAGQKQTPLTAVVKQGLMNVPKGEAEVQAAMDEGGGGFLVNVSRSVLYAAKGDGYAKAARKEAMKVRNRINVMRDAVLARRTGGSPPGR